MAAAAARAIGVIAGAAMHLAIGLAVKAGGFTFYGTLAAFIVSCVYSSSTRPTT